MFGESKLLAASKPPGAAHDAPYRESAQESSVSVFKAVCFTLPVLGQGRARILVVLSVYPHHRRVQVLCAFVFAFVSLCCLFRFPRSATDFRAISLRGTSGRSVHGAV